VRCVLVMCISVRWCIATSAPSSRLSSLEHEVSMSMFSSSIVCFLVLVFLILWFPLLVSPFFFPPPPPPRCSVTPPVHLLRLRATASVQPPPPLPLILRPPSAVPCCVLYVRACAPGPSSDLPRKRRFVKQSHHFDGFPSAVAHTISASLRPNSCLK